MNIIVEYLKKMSLIYGVNHSILFAFEVERNE